MLKELLKNDIIKYTKLQDRDAVNILKLVVNDVNMYYLKYGTESDDKKIKTVIKNFIHKSEESYTEYKKAGRPDLAEKEKYEKDILSSYL